MQDSYTEVHEEEKSEEAIDLLLLGTGCLVEYDISWGKGGKGSSSNRGGAKGEGGREGINRSRSLSGGLGGCSQKKEDCGGTHILS